MSRDVREMTRIVVLFLPFVYLFVSLYFCPVVNLLSLLCRICVDFLLCPSLSFWRTRLQLHPNNPFMLLKPLLRSYIMRYSREYQIYILLGNAANERYPRQNSFTKISKYNGIPHNKSYDIIIRYVLESYSLQRASHVLS